MADARAQWGEFLDHEWYDNGESARPEPWRTHPNAQRAFLFPRALLEDLAQPDRLREIRGSARVRLVRDQLLRDGLREPLEFVIDTDGLLALRDGHHRLLASQDLTWCRKMPAFFSRSTRLRVANRRACDLLEQLLREGEPIRPAPRISHRTQRLTNRRRF